MSQAALASSIRAALPRKNFLFAWLWGETDHAGERNQMRDAAGESFHDGRQQVSSNTLLLAAARVFERVTARGFTDAIVQDHVGRELARLKSAVLFPEAWLADQVFELEIAVDSLGDTVSRDELNCLLSEAAAMFRDATRDPHSVLQEMAA